MTMANGGLAKKSPAVTETAPSSDGGRVAHERIRSAPGWRIRLLVLGATVAVFVALFGTTFASMVATWWRSETFAHGFVIAPISLYLIWRKREALRRIAPRTGWLALVPLAALGGLWLLGSAADVLGVQQFAVVAMIPVLAALILGWTLVRRIAFPLAFLLLGVPIGEALVPPLIEFTALFTVNALQLTGIPVYWEGARFSIPSGDWSVVKACSGVRYVFATLTVTLLFAYLNFRSYWRRIAFVVLAIGLAIFANGVRAYAIVMIGHLSEMRLAVGVDHFIYGWVFFALLMVLIFWIGGFFRERDGGPAEPAFPVAAQQPTEHGWPRPAGAAVIALGVLAVFPAWAAYVESRAPEAVQAHLDAPNGAAVWEPAVEDPGMGWQPRYVNPGAEVNQIYRHGPERVGLHVAYYPVQEQGAELVNYRNVLVQEKDHWHVVARGAATLTMSDTALQVTEARLRSYRGDLLVWKWYWIEGSHMSNAYLVKAYEALDRLLTGRRRGAGIVVYTPVDRDVGAARDRLRRFTAPMIPGVDNMLQRAEGR